ncbi:DUF3416 domain-containing protein, partial [bacterium]|nr:DUF3416 domain-containing protein [bacterium]
MMDRSKWNGRKRVTIEKVQPEIDGGRYPIKRVVGESVRVKADIFCDGHDSIRAVLYYKQTTEATWHPVEMHYGVNDRWHAQFPITQLAPYEYKISAWVDHFKTWRNDLWKKWNANQAEDIDLRMGVQWLEPVAARAEGVDKQRIQAAIDRLRSSASLAERIQAAMEPDLEICVNRYPDYTQASEYEKTLQVAVDREKARFSAWYEMFPRSAAQQPGKHGTFADVERRLPYIQEMGFDVLYLPPIHPIGTTHRKGKNNSTTAEK